MLEFSKKMGDKPAYAARTVLELAVEHGSNRLVKEILPTGATPSPKILIEAVRNADFNSVIDLLKCGLDVNFLTPGTEFTALMLAASRNTIEIAELLLEHWC